MSQMIRQLAGWLEEAEIATPEQAKRLVDVAEAEIEAQRKRDIENRRKERAAYDALSRKAKLKLWRGPFTLRPPHR